MIAQQALDRAGHVSGCTISAPGMWVWTRHDGEYHSEHPFAEFCLLCRYAKRAVRNAVLRSVSHLVLSGGPTPSQDETAVFRDKAGVVLSHEALKLAVLLRCLEDPSKHQRVCHTDAGSSTELDVLLVQFPGRVHSTPVGGWACRLPREVERLRMAFAAGSPSRRLDWNVDLGRAVIRAEFGVETYDLEVSTHEMCILMLFNDADTLSFKVLCARTFIHVFPQNLSTHFVRPFPRRLRSGPKT